MQPLMDHYRLVGWRIAGAPKYLARSKISLEIFRSLQVDILTTCSASLSVRTLPSNYVLCSDRAHNAKSWTILRLATLSNIAAMYKEDGKCLATACYSSSPTSRSLPDAPYRPFQSSYRPEFPFLLHQSTGEYRQTAKLAKPGPSTSDLTSTFSSASPTDVMATALRI